MHTVSNGSSGSGRREPWKRLLRTTRPSVLVLCGSAGWQHDVRQSECTTVERLIVVQTAWRHFQPMLHILWLCYVFIEWTWPLISFKCCPSNFIPPGKKEPMLDYYKTDIPVRRVVSAWKKVCLSALTRVTIQTLSQLDLIQMMSERKGLFRTGSSTVGAPPRCYWNNI